MIPALIWTCFGLLALHLTKRWLDRHVQLLGYYFTKNQGIALVIYAIIFFPGVLLHELSHWLFAQLLGARTGRISLIPSMGKDGKFQLGAVEYYAGNLDPIRESLIGAAPLICGSLTLLLIANHLFGLPEASEVFEQREWWSVVQLYWDSLHTPDFWLWFYLAFAVANAMMPSAADRRAWPAFAVIVMLTLMMILLLGLGDWLMISMEKSTALWLNYLATALSLTVSINLLIMVGIFVLERFLSFPWGRT